MPPPVTLEDLILPEIKFLETPSPEDIATRISSAVHNHDTSTSIEQEQQEKEEIAQLEAALVTIMPPRKRILNAGEV